MRLAFTNNHSGISKPALEVPRSCTWTSGMAARTFRSWRARPSTRSDVFRMPIQGRGQCLGYAQDERDRHLAGLEQTTLRSSRHSDWEDWPRSTGVDIARANSLDMYDYNLVLAAAVDRLGVAMGRLRMVQSMLDDGLLVPAWPGFQFHPVLPIGRRRRKSGRCPSRPQVSSDGS